MSASRKLFGIASTLVVVSLAQAGLAAEPRAQMLAMDDMKPIAAIRHVEGNPVRMCIVDGEQAFMTLLHDADVHPSYDAGVWVNTKLDNLLPFQKLVVFFFGQRSRRAGYHIREVFAQDRRAPISFNVFDD